MHEGMKAPDFSMKQAKYASFLFVRVSTVARIMKPIVVGLSANVIWNERSRKWSDERQMIRRTTVPTRKAGLRSYSTEQVDTVKLKLTKLDFALNFFRSKLDGRSNVQTECGVKYHQSPGIFIALHVQIFFKGVGRRRVGYIR